MTDLSPAHLATLTQVVAPSLMAAVKITAEDNRIVLNFADLSAALELWKPWGSAAKRAEFLQRFEQMLLRLNVVIEFRVEGRLLGGFGPGTHAGILRRLIA
ncbi:MAG: hypothetical protein K2X03_23140 [Bryobacteraceae bacterium]|nr:hypothetical protein [Bryobacteraceae bacterium]